jgi:hypothetical protein
MNALRQLSEKAALSDQIVIKASDGLVSRPKGLQKPGKGCAMAERVAVSDLRWVDDGHFQEEKRKRYAT